MRALSGSPEQHREAALPESTAARALSPAAVRIIPFIVFIALLALQATLTGHVQAWGFDPRWLYAVRITIVGGLLALWWRHYTELHGFAGVTGGRIAAWVTAGVVVFVLWINLDFPWARLGSGGGFDPTLEDGSTLTWPIVIFRLLGLAIVVPVMEELFWRSFIMRWLERQDFLRQDPARIGFRALLICAVLFALEHHLWLAGLIAGVVYGLAYIWGRSLWLAIISHATTNAVLGGWILATRSWHLW